MIAKDHCRGKLQTCDCLDQPKITVAQITNKKQGIRLKLIEQPLIMTSPVTMKVSGYGEAQSGQEWCLGFQHPARYGQNVCY